MASHALHRFTRDGRRYALDPESCFCFECDDVSWDVLDHYPSAPVNRIYHELAANHSSHVLTEVIGELEWLRASKSILSVPKREDTLKQFEMARGLNRLTILLPNQPPAAETLSSKRRWFGSSPTSPSAGAYAAARAAITLLFARSGSQQELYLDLLIDGVLREPNAVTEIVEEAFRTAGLSGKQLTVAVTIRGIAVSRSPKCLDGHLLSATIEFRKPQLSADRLVGLSQLTDSTKAGQPLSRWSRILESETPDVVGLIHVRPNHTDFNGIVKELEGAGFPYIRIEIDDAFVANPRLDADEVMKTLAHEARYYAQRLLEQRYFRVEPIADLFRRIYEGIPIRRIDPAGVNELAVGESGVLFPSASFIGTRQFELGNLADNSLKTEALDSFENIGVMITPVCRSCWARHLCGGGNSAVHFALSESHRTPHEPWCNAQRMWLEDAIAAFNLLSAQGVNFTRAHSSIVKKRKPSLFTMLRTALQTSLSVRPIEEADAELLVKWENWTPAAYFLYNERGLLLATKYDREMDSLHPQGIDQEMLLTRRNGAPIGLLKLRPDRTPGSATAWLYMRNEEDYSQVDVRRSLGAILSQFATHQEFRRVLVPALESETTLGQLLSSLEFKKEGILRDAVFLHGDYHAVGMYVR